MSYHWVLKVERLYSNYILILLSVTIWSICSFVIVSGVAGLQLNGAKQLYTPPPVTAAPYVSNIFTPPPVVPAAFTRSISTPSFNSETVTQAGQSPAYLAQPENSRTLHTHAKSTNNLSGNLGKPLFDLKDHSFGASKNCSLSQHPFKCWNWR